MTANDGSIGRTDFIERFGLWTDTQRAAAREVAAMIERGGIETVRVGFVDQHGLVRGKTVVRDEMAGVMRNGCAITTTLLAKDTAHRTVFPVFSAGGGFGLAAMEGAGDFVMVPDPATYRVLPWAPGSAIILSDIYFQDGTPVPFSTRRRMQDALAALAASGFDYVSGLEVEFYVFKLLDPKLKPEHATQPPTPPEVELLARGYHYLTDLRFDQLEPVIELIRREVVAMGLPVRTIESEFGASQFEFTFAPCTGIDSADNMALFRNAVKQICRRHGYHATFMCRPGLANCFASGWHLHQSLRDRRTGANAFMTERAGEDLSPVGLGFAAGILAHARAASVFTTPTINGYKRYRPNSLAPDRAIWGRDQKGAMLRLVTAGPRDPGTRLENRVGEPAANPYLYLGSQIVAGLDGIGRGLVPMQPADAPYETRAEPLPKSLMEACAALRADTMFRAAWSDRFVDYILDLKEAEIARFLSEVTDWEHREYFEMF